MDVLIAADLLNLPRLVHISELCLQNVQWHPPPTHTHTDSLDKQVIDAGNAVPLFLAASYHGAKQLRQTCEYWMAVNYKQTEQHEQWQQVPDDVKKSVLGEYQRLTAERDRLRKAQNLPCVLAEYQWLE